MTEKSDYSYSIQNLQESLREVMVGEYTPKEIHEVIVDTVKDNMRYYKACYNDSVRLLALLRGNANRDIKVHDGDDPSYKEFREALEKFRLDSNSIDTSKFKLDSPELHNNDEDEV